MIIRDVAQPGSASRSGRGGRWFESSHPDGYAFKLIEKPINSIIYGLFLCFLMFLTSILLKQFQ